MTDCPHCRRLREEADELREELRQVRQELIGQNASLGFPSAWRLTSSEELILHVLCERRLASRADLERAFVARQPDWDAEPKVFDVWLCKMRRKLAPWGVQIETRHGIGYSMSEDLRAAVERARETGQPQVAPPLTEQDRQPLWPQLKAALKKYPGGLSARELLAELGPDVRRDSLASALSYFVSTGKLEREDYRRDRRSHRMINLYRLPRSAGVHPVQPSVAA